jgi:SAM-dependent methyltransferase
MNHKDSSRAPQGKTPGTFSSHGVRDYEQKRYRGLDQRVVNSREQRIIRRILKKVIKGKVNGLKVLDVPCGYGRFTQALLTGQNCLIDSDLSFYMVKRAVERGKDFQEFVLGAVADTKKGLPFKENAFDLLLSMRFFHHVHEGKDREAILHEFCRVSKEWVILSYYRANLIHQLQRKMRHKVKRKQTHISIISSQRFKQEVIAAGFEIIKTYPVIKGIHSQWVAFLRKVKT